MSGWLVSFSVGRFSSFSWDIHSMFSSTFVPSLCLGFDPSDGGRARAFPCTDGVGGGWQSTVARVVVVFGCSSSSTPEWLSIPLESFFSPGSNRRIRWKKKAKTTRPKDLSEGRETIEPTDVGIRNLRHHTCRRNRRERRCPRPCRREWEGRERPRFPIEAVRNANHTNQETSENTSAS